MTDTTTDFFDNTGGGSGAPTALLKNVDDVVSGEIVEMFKRDYVPFGAKDPEPDSNEADGKRKQLVVILQTDQRNWANVNKVPKVDPADPNSAEKAPAEDDGKRAIYVPNRSNIQYAIGKAVREASAKFEVGGQLAVKIFNLKDTGKGNPLKEHVARYAPPTDNFFQEQSAPAQTAPVTQPPAQEQAPAAPAQQAPQTDPWASSGQTQTVQQDPWASSAPSTSQPPF